MLSRLGGKFYPCYDFVDWIGQVLSELVRESQGHLRIVKLLQSRRRLIRIIQPGNQVTVYKELLAQ